MKKLLKNTYIPLIINSWWNYGFILSIFIIIQITSGLILSIYYRFNNPFINTFNLYFNVNYGWIIRIIHRNFSSFIFISIYIHIIRGFFFNSSKNKKIWFSGLVIMFILIITAFIGYTLPWRQISYWGIIVITNLISTIPYIGRNILFWLWGNFNINFISLNRIFILHFILPLCIILFILIHLIILHKYFSNNPLGTNKFIDVTILRPYFIIKDLIIFIFLLIIIINFILTFPFLLNNPDNFSSMNYYVTPIHIEPEWYFLFFYSILRSIDNKLNGLLLIIISVIIFFIYPLYIKLKFQSIKLYIYIIIIFSFLINLIILIRWLGAKIIEYPYLQVNKIRIIIYFIIFLIINFYIIIIDLNLNHK